MGEDRKSGIVELVDYDSLMDQMMTIFLKRVKVGLSYISYDWALFSGEKGADEVFMNCQTEHFDLYRMFDRVIFSHEKGEAHYPDYIFRNKAEH